MNKDILNYGLPEEVGVSSKQVTDFLDDIKDRGLMLHSIIMIRRGKVFAEGYYKPFKQDELHRMYSVSKTFVSTAIGLLAEEGKIKLSDKITVYFRDKCPPKIPPYLADTTIRDLLIMATPYSTGTTYKNTDPDWCSTFFKSTPDHPAGTIFNYDTSGTYILNVLIERVTGMPFLEYLKNKALRKIGFSENAWCIKAPEGNSWGGSGVMCSTRDLARLALLYINGGRFDGEQLLPEQYLKEAISRQIDNAPSGHKTYISGNGYGYQIWMTHDGSYSFVGMGGQLAVIIPEKDFIMVCTGDVQGNPTTYEGIYEALWNKIIDKIGYEPLTTNLDNHYNLMKTLGNLSAVLPNGSPSSPFLAKMNNAVYELAPNPMKISRLCLSFSGNDGIFRYVTDEGMKELRFGLGKYVIDRFPQTNYYGPVIGTKSDKMYRCMSAAVWTEEQKLVLRTYLIDDYFGNFTATFSFKGNQIAVSMKKTAEWFLDEYEGIAGGQRVYK